MWPSMRWILGLSLALALLPGAAQGTSVRSVSVRELLDGSEFVFEGRVLAVETLAGASPRSIQTCVLFEIRETLKGSVADSTIELCFAGGSIGRITRRVSAMTYPERGETGIYFVESLAEPRVHPLFGWQQGHFRIVSDPGSPDAAVTAADGRAVVAIDPAPGPSPTGLSAGVARGIVVAAPGAAPTDGSAVRRPSTAAPAPEARPLSPGAFKAELRALLVDRGR